MEHAILRHLGEIARQKGLQRVQLPFLRSARNEPAWAFAESVAAQFRSTDGDREIYDIPTEAALTIQHRPGHDPDAVIKARDSDAKMPVVRASSTNVSRRYAALSQLWTGQHVLDAVNRANARTSHPPWKPCRTIE